MYAMFVLDTRACTCAKCLCKDIVQHPGARTNARPAQPFAARTVCSPSCGPPAHSSRPHPVRSISTRCASLLASWSSCAVRTACNLLTVWFRKHMGHDDDAAQARQLASWFPLLVCADAVHMKIAASQAAGLADDPLPAVDPRKYFGPSGPAVCAMVLVCMGCALTYTHLLVYAHTHAHTHTHWLGWDACQGDGY